MGHLTRTETGRPTGTARTETAGPAGFVGIVCGLKVEADCVAAALAAVPGSRSRVRIGVSGARPAEAEAIARGFAEDGALSLVSFGIAGALDASLAAADVVVAVKVTDGIEHYSCAPLAGPWPAHWRQGLLFGCDRMIGEPAEKAALGAGGRLAVDMESHRVARIAAAGGMPLYAVRAISDTLAQRIPAYVARGVRPDGAPRIGPILAGLARTPNSFGDLLALRRGTNAALVSLAAVARHLVEAAAAPGQRSGPE